MRKGKIKGGVWHIGAVRASKHFDFCGGSLWANEKFTGHAMRNSPSSLSPSDALAATVAEEQTPKTSPDAIDARRAQQLLERAAALAGRGDMGAAVLATRQSLALAPSNVEGHLLLARLLERNRDFGGARAAYEKSVQLAPDRADARDNLTRINNYLEQSQSAARQFHFDSDELFASADDVDSDQVSASNSAPETPVASAPILVAPVASASATSAPADFDAMELLDESMLPALEARLPPSREEASPEVGAAPTNEPRVETPRVASPVAASAAQVEKSVGDRRKHNVPVATERRRRPASALPIPLTPAPLQPAALQPAPLQAAPLRASDNFDLQTATAPRLPLDLDLPAAPRVPLWQQVAARPSFYARTLPVVAVAVLSLGFLSWARGRAVSRVIAPASTELAQANLPDASQTSTSNAPALGATNGATNGAAPAGNDASGFPISNAPVTFQAPPASPNANAATASNNANSPTARANNRASGGGGSTPRFPRRVLPPSRPVPNFPGVSLAPAPIPPVGARSTTPRAGSNQGGSNIILPSPSVDLSSAPAPRQRVLPPGDNGLNPAGSPGRGYVRITEGRVGNGVIPQQPSSVARQNESSAGDAARNGQTDQAISQLSQAIRADSENAGFRYQQRATLFLQRGDYNRASEDFQAAISAYQNQINSGDDVAQARRGLSSARSGLNLALAGKRG